jgi:dTDP-4-amino-4,6-dideoxygalactose transaminase
VEVKFFKQAEINRQYAHAVHSAVDELLLGSVPLVNGRFGAAFERAFADYVATEYCSFVSNGLDALILALRAAGVQRGDSVIVPCHTYIATWMAPLALGCKLIAAPVRDDDLLLDPTRIEDYIQPSTACIMPVHLYGNPCDMEAINTIATRHNLLVIEDAAQAHGSSFQNKKIGSWGDATCFSFYPTKNLGALGEGGAVTTNRLDIHAKIASLKNYGRSPNDGSTNIYLGGNHRGDEIQAAFLASKLMNLNHITERRQRVVSQYVNGLELRHTHGSLLHYSRSSSPHLAILKTSSGETRNNLAAHLREKNITTAVHYSRPCHAQPCLDANMIDIDEECKKQATQIANTILSLPMSECHTTAEIDYVVMWINDFFGSHSASVLQ